jgi:hypothetical protein
VVVLCRRLGSGHQAQAARHSKMDQQVAIAEIEQQVFAAARDPVPGGDRQAASQDPQAADSAGPVPVP